MIGPPQGESAKEKAAGNAIIRELWEGIWCKNGPKNEVKYHEKGKAARK